MNFNIGKICLLLATFIAYTSTMSCSHSPSGIRNRAFSNQNIDKLAALHTIHHQTDCPKSSLENPQKNQGISSQTIRNLSDITAKQIVTTALDNSINLRQETSSTSSDITGSDFRAITIEIPTGIVNDYASLPRNQLRRRRIACNEWSSDSSNAWSDKNLENKPFEFSPTFLAKIAESEKTQAQLTMMQNKRLLFSGCSVAIPLLAAKLLGDGSESQTRFGLAAATTIISILPTLLTTLVGGYFMYEINQLFHARERALESKIGLLERDMTGLKAQQKNVEKLLSKETIDRIKGDQDITQKITNLTTDVKHALAEYHLAGNKLNDTYNIATEVKKVNELLITKYQFMMKKLNEILVHTSKMSKNIEANNSNNYIDSQLDNIEYFLKNSNNNKEEEKSDINPKIQPRRALSQSKISVPTSPQSHASTDIFKKKEGQNSGFSDWAKIFTAKFTSSNNQNRNFAQK